MRHLISNKVYLLFTFIFIVSCNTVGNEEYLSEITSLTTKVATCTGSSNCKACKNCKYCKHCSKDKGSCGVCK